MSVNDLVNQINELNYDDKKKLYTRCFSSGYFSSGHLNDKLAIISLVGLSVSKLKLKNPEMNTLEFLSKITGTKEGSAGYKMMEGFSIVIDDLCYEIVKYDTFKLDNSKDIVNKIKETFDTWLPF